MNISHLLLELSAVDVTEKKKEVKALPQFVNCFCKHPFSVFSKAKTFNNLITLVLPSSQGWFMNQRTCCCIILKLIMLHIGIVWKYSVLTVFVVVLFLFLNNSAMKMFGDNRIPHKNNWFRKESEMEGRCK